MVLAQPEASTAVALQVDPEVTKGRAAERPTFAQLHQSTTESPLPLAVEVPADSLVAREVLVVVLTVQPE